MKKTVLYIGNFKFPLGNASGKRVYANGKILRELGYTVIFIGMDHEISNKVPIMNTKNSFDGFSYYNFSYPKSHIEWLNYNQTFNRLIKLLEDEKILHDLDFVIMYGSIRISVLNNKLIYYFKKNSIKTVVDVVDWLSVKTSNPLFDLVKWVDNIYKRKYLNKKVDGIIVISKFLSSYYENIGCKTVIIPPLSPIDYSLSKTQNKSSKKIITYAGNPFRKGQLINDLSTLKDRIDITIFLLYEAKKNGANFVFNIYGFTKEEYLHSIPSQVKYVEGLANSIKFHGMKANNEVTEEISKADFTILIRDVNRDTTAGFPTKVSESISCGTPVITTKTSDLEDYIIDRGNGFFIDIQNEKEAVISLLNILRLNKEVMLTMKKHCREQNIFHYKNYELKMSEFFNEFK